MRPLIHLTAPSGWINDPHAITVRDGVHHLFHQYVPDSLVHDPACRWGHAVSPDLVHWEHRPVAIEPGDGDDGIWTGSLAQADDGPVILSDGPSRSTTGGTNGSRRRSSPRPLRTWISSRTAIHSSCARRTDGGSSSAQVLATDMRWR